METLQALVGFIFFGVIIVGLISLILAKPGEQIIVGIASMLIGYGLHNILSTTTIGGVLLLGGLGISLLGFASLTPKHGRRGFY